MPLSSVIAVAATTSTDARASYSSTGPDVELAAPGSSIRSTLMGGGYGSKSGTSMAAPHVAGTVALVLGAGVPAPSVRDLLAMTAEDLGSQGRDNHFGFGLVDAALAVSIASGGSDPLPPPDEEQPPSDPRYIAVASIQYGLSGGKTNDKHLDVTLQIIDDELYTIAGATVSITLFLNGSQMSTASGVTNAQGQFTTSLKNARSGTWTTVVNTVSAEGYTWDGTSPNNEFIK